MIETDTETNAERDLKIPGIIGFVVLLSVILLRAPLGRSLWLDETVTSWVTAGSFTDTIHRSIEYQGQSPLYFVILFGWRALFGSTEFALRSLSLLITAISFVLLYRLAKVLRIREVVPFVLIPFLSLEEVTRAAFGARPYALGLLGVVWSFLALICYCERGSVRDLTGYVLGSLIAFYSHYLFGLIAVVHLAILWSRRGSVRLRPLVLAWTIAIALSLPGLYHILLWTKKADTINFHYIPSVFQLLIGATPRHVSIYLCLSVLLAFIWTKVRWIHGRNQDLVWIIVAIVTAPLGLYLLTLFTGGTLFIDRYYMWRAVGVALLVGVIFARIDPRKARMAALLGWLFFAVFLEGLRQWQIEEWKQASQFVREQSPDLPVLLYSGLIESEQVDWEEGDERAKYISAPLQAYPVPNRIVSIPSNFDTPAKAEYYGRVVKPLLEDYESLLFILWRGPKEGREPSLFGGKLEGFELSVRETRSGLVVYGIATKKRD